MLATGLGTGAPTAAAALVALGVEIVVVGGCALVLHGVEDRCRDLDIVPEPGAENLERLCTALDALGAWRADAQTIAARNVTSVASPYGRIDLLTATATREYPHLAASSTQLHVLGVPVPVAAVADALRLRAEFKGGGQR